MPHMAHAANYQTYAILAPISTHFRKGTCAEAECANHLNGWITRVPAGSAMEAMVRSSRRHWVSENLMPGGVIEFRFEPGQQCFLAPHNVRLEREELFVVRGGDDRGNPRGNKRLHASPADWTEDFMEHQAGLVEEAERG